MHDACYHKVMRSYGRWSARAAQAVAKCRKAKGQVRKGEAGKSLRDWEKQRWVNKRTGKPCGSQGSARDRLPEYCRPTRRSGRTPKMNPKNVRSNLRRKSRGLRARRAK